MDATASSSQAPSAWSLENVLFALLVAALPLSFASGFTTYETLKHGLLSIGGGLLLLLWTLRALRGQTLTVRGGLALLPLFGLATFAALSAIWAPNAVDALVESGRWFALLAVVLVVLDPFERPVPFNHFALALGLGIGGAALVGILQGFGVEVDASAPSLASEGLRATFDAEPSAALTIACALPVLAAGLFSSRGAGRVIVGVGLALGAFYLGAANVLEAYIAVGVGVGVSVAVIALGHGVHGMVPSYGALASLGAAAVLMVGGAFATPGAPDRSDLPAELAGTDLERGNYAVDEVDWSRATPPTSDLGQRYAVSTGMAVFASRPVAGTGAGNYDAIAPGWADRTSAFYDSVIVGRHTFRSTHNAWVQVLAELGLIGIALLGLFLLIVLGSLWQAMRKSAKDSDEGQGLPLLHLFGLVGTLAALVVAFSFEDLLSQSVGGLLFFATSAFVMRDSFILLEGRGLARPWLLSRETLGAQGFERYVLAGVLPLAAATLAIYFASITTASDYYKARGDVWLRAGMLENAITAYRDAVAVNPLNALAWFQLAEVSMVDAELEQAEDVFETALVLRPYDPRLYAGLGNLQGRLALERGRKKMTGPPPGAPPEGQPADPKGPPSSPQAIDTNALLANIDRDTVSRAESSFNRAIELHPRYAAAYQGLGNLYVTDKKVDKAIATYLRALEKQPESRRRKIADLHIRIGQLYTVDEKWNDAERHLRRALEVYPEHPGRKTILVDLGEIDARRSGKPAPKDEHDHGHGAVPLDVNKLREQRREEREHGEHGESPNPTPAPAPESPAPPAPAPGGQPPAPPASPAPPVP